MDENTSRAKAGTYHGNQYDGSSHDVTTLADLGIGKMQSSRFQQIAAIPEDKFEQHIAETKADGEELTSAGMRRLAVELKRSRVEPVAAETPPFPQGIPFHLSGSKNAPSPPHLRF